MMMGRININADAKCEEIKFALNLPQKLLIVALALVFIAVIAVLIFGITQKYQLHFACEYGDWKKVKALIEKKPQLINTKNKIGEYPIHCAVKSRNQDILELLLANGANVESKWIGASSTQDGLTPLHLAASWGYLDMVKLLLANGANPNALTVQGATPLELAEKNGHTDVVDYLKSINKKPFKNKP